jgi:hypothetical protein
MSQGTDLETARAAKPKAYEVFRELVGEVAVGITALDDGEYGLKVNLEKAPGKGIKLPKEIEGVPVSVDVVGKIRKR